VAASAFKWCVMLHCLDNRKNLNGKQYAVGISARVNVELIYLQPFET
jgi:hypothetical protein